MVMDVAASKLVNPSTVKDGGRVQILDFTAFLAAGFGEAGMGLKSYELEIVCNIRKGECVIREIRILCSHRLKEQVIRDRLMQLKDEKRDCFVSCRVMQ